MPLCQYCSDYGNYFVRSTAWVLWMIVAV
jgi:hypothetical protein